MYIAGLFLTCIGSLGFLGAIAAFLYGKYKHSAGWLIGSQETGMRAILILIVGLLILAGSK